MFWASLIFMLFPILPVVIGELPAWHLLVDILFVVTYLGVLITKNQRLSWLFWGIMLVYVAGNTAFVAGNYISYFCRFDDFGLGSNSPCRGFERSSGQAKYPDKSIASRK
ncbi:histidine kinase [Streptococcus pneumoniae]|nr:histidine kinase [Streptococcus pneumoniae]